LIKVISSLQL